PPPRVCGGRAAARPTSAHSWRPAARAASSPRPSSPARCCWPCWSPRDRYPRSRMTVDLAVATPPFLDLTFVGLEGLPAPGEERFAADLVRSPGGGAITAVGAARLGLSTALAAPLGEDDAGDFVRAALQRDGVATPDRRRPPTAHTLLTPV